MSSKSEAILSSHRDAATRITKHFAARHNLKLKPNDALDAVALVLGAANWKTLRAMAEQGRAPRMSDVVTPAVDLVPAAPQPRTLAQALYKAPDLATLRAAAKGGKLPAERTLAAYEFVVALEKRNQARFLANHVDWKSHIEAAQNEVGVQLSNGQDMAACSLANRTFSVLAGPTGTGKTTCLKVFAGALRHAGEHVLDLCLPEAMTLLEQTLYWQKTGAFKTAFPFDTILLDERAFENASVTQALLSALPDTCRVILVVDTKKDPLFTDVARALKSVPNSVLIGFSKLFRQIEPDKWSHRPVLPEMTPVKEGKDQ